MVGAQLAMRPMVCSDWYGRERCRSKSSWPDSPVATLSELGVDTRSYQTALIPDHGLHVKVLLAGRRRKGSLVGIRKIDHIGVYAVSDNSSRIGDFIDLTLYIDNSYDNVNIYNNC